jgi:hypothetical protein
MLLRGLSRYLRRRFGPRKRLGGRWSIGPGAAITALYSVLLRGAGEATRETRKMPSAFRLDSSWDLRNHIDRCRRERNSGTDGNPFDVPGVR